MSHIHIPDGVLPLWIILLGWAVTLVLLGVLSRHLDEDNDFPRRLPLLGVVSALMLVGMTVEFVPLAYHFNLTVIAGIILGPALGFVAAFVVDLILAMFGHGGITVVGLNTLIVGAEIAIGYYLFRAASRFLGSLIRRLGLRTGLATVLTLFLSTSLMVAVVGLANVNPAWQAPRDGSAGSDSISFRNLFGEGAFRVELFPGAEQPASDGKMNLLTFAELVYLLGIPGWLAEAFITGLTVSYVARVRPDLVKTGA